MWWSVALACACSSACSRPATQAPAAGPDITLQQVTLRNYRGSSLQLEATAPRVEVLRATMDLWAVDAGLSLKESGATLAAPSVVGNVQSGHLEGRGGVTLWARDGLEGRSPLVVYERTVGAQGAAFSDAGVSVSHPRFTHEAEGFSVDFAEQRAEFVKPRTTALPAPAEP